MPRCELTYCTINLQLASHCPCPSPWPDLTEPICRVFDKRDLPPPRERRRASTERFLGLVAGIITFVSCRHEFAVIYFRSSERGKPRGATCIHPLVLSRESIVRVTRHRYSEQRAASSTRLLLEITPPATTSSIESQLHPGQHSRSSTLSLSLFVPVEKEPCRCRFHQDGL